MAAASASRRLIVAVLYVFVNVQPACLAWTTQSRRQCTALRSAAVEESRAVSRDEQVQHVLNLARDLGPVGTRQSEQDQQKILNAALQLEQFSDSSPAKIPLTGIHELLYSAAPGGSSGKIGPWDGKVTQEFVDDTRFINAVELGPVKIALQASREIKNDKTIAVKFQKTTVSVFGATVVEKETGGGGAWKLIFAGEVKDSDDNVKLLRIMQTPSLFVIQQDITP